jgi:hypothetical protein
MPRPAIVRRVRAAPTDEDFFIRLTTHGLLELIADLRRRVERSGTPRAVAQVLLAEAHIAEAVGLLRAIQPMPSKCELAAPGPLLRAAPHARTQPQRAQRAPRPRRVHHANGLAS